MPHLLSVEDGNSVSQFPLNRGSSRLGSGAECEVHVEHGEVQAVALLLNLRDDAMTVGNNNPYSVYVGDRELPAGQTTAWPSGVPLRMTRSITVTFLANGAKTAAAAAKDAGPVEAKPESSAKKKLVQICVILFCVLVGITQMNKAPEVEEEPGISFEELRGRIDNTLDQFKKDPAKSYEWQTVRRLLQEAEYLSFRPSEFSPELKIAAYQRVLDHPLIQNPKPETLESSIYQYATIRKAKLSGE
jgi:hypothetical protein